jgi:2-dehydrotetronate isomerase
MPRLSANLSFLFAEVPFLDRFGAAARAGFRAVEFAFAYDLPSVEIAARLAQHDLQCVLINAPPGDFDAGERGIASLPGREDEFAASIGQALRLASTIGCPRIHVMSGVVPPDADDAARALRRAKLVTNLRRACAEAARSDVTLLVEALNPHDVPHYLFSTQADAHSIREEVGAPNLRVQMDFYHTQMVEGGIATKFERWLPHIGHVQIAGVPGRHEPDIGEVNYGWLLQRVDALGYVGWVGCEYRPHGATLSGLAWRERLLVPAS